MRSSDKKVPHHKHDTGLLGGLSYPTENPKGSLMDRRKNLLECELNGRNRTINVGYEVINTSNRARQVKANLIACMYRSGYLLSHQLTGIAVNTEHGLVGIDMKSNLTILVDRYITLVAAIGLNTVDACGL